MPTEASNSDGIKSKVVKILKRTLAPTVSMIIINKINNINLTKFSDELKIARIKPLRKEKEGQGSNSYRPVSVLSVFSKFSIK